MIRLNLQLLPDTLPGNQVAASNKLSEKSCNHLRGLIGNMKCRKHPSFKNVIKIVAVEGKDPKVEVVSICCQEFLQRLGR